jgi:hypothetical protein
MAEPVMRLARYLWAGPVTIVGLATATLAAYRGGVRIVDGVVEAFGPVLAWTLRRLVPIEGGAAAITLGHVVIACDERVLDETRAHERTHVAQYERWGVCFLPAYAAASIWAAVRGGHYYRDNRFEQEARAGEGSYGVRGGSVAAK